MQGRQRTRWNVHEMFCLWSVQRDIAMFDSSWAPLSNVEQRVQCLRMGVIHCVQKRTADLLPDLMWTFNGPSQDRATWGSARVTRRILSRVWCVLIISDGMRYFRHMLVALCLQQCFMSCTHLLIYTRTLLRQVCYSSLYRPARI